MTLPNGEECEMIAIEKPKKHYLLMESINKNEYKLERTLHLLSPDEGQRIRIGRGEECEVELGEQSISRVHSEIRFKDGEFYLKDNGSTYGTLVKFEEELELEESVTIQSNRATYNFQVMKKGSMEEKEKE